MLREVIAAIRPLDAAAMTGCRRRLDNLTKPLGSLQALEDLLVRLAGITGQPRLRALKKSIILVAADHGVATEGVSAYPPEVTTQMVVNFCRSRAAINVLARHAAAELVLVDAGVAADLPDMPGLVRAKIAYGTENIANGPAMTVIQAVAAVEAGIRVARAELAKGVQVIGLGEMGIANTTPSTAVIACYASRPVRELTGGGTGIGGSCLEHKAEVIDRALALNRPDRREPLDVLHKVGGFEIAVLTGVILAAAAGRAAVVVDGITTAAAALLATELAPQAREYLIGSHFSCEPAQRAALGHIGLTAYLHLDLRLGEGSGAALGMRLIDAGLAVLNDMKTFDEAQVSVAQDGLGAAVSAAKL